MLNRLAPTPLDMPCVSARFLIPIFVHNLRATRSFSFDIKGKRTSRRPFFVDLPPIRVLQETLFRLVVDLIMYSNYSKRLLKCSGERCDAQLPSG
jgi:hypothetical protein